MLREGGNSFVSFRENSKKEVGVVMRTRSAIASAGKAQEYGIPEQNSAHQYILSTLRARFSETDKAALEISNRISLSPCLFALRR